MVVATRTLRVSQREPIGVLTVSQPPLAAFPCALGSPVKSYAVRAVPPRACASVWALSELLCCSVVVHSRGFVLRQVASCFVFNVTLSWTSSAACQCASDVSVKRSEPGTSTEPRSPAHDATSRFVTSGPSGHADPSEPDPPRPDCGRMKGVNASHLPTWGCLLANPRATDLFPLEELRIIYTKL
ncbi:hypothetical protein NDU88_000664 [Pleurodeles waltl]|uniref:Uncharacterized protein n=1 Tax=Pleurodeles waltl TaxID=8319 RepID=A0AAV7KYG8_PLEWA|nr:hypothetical protein NDU88_000664 [Pleurodeles waltl]